MADRNVDAVTTYDFPTLLGEYREKHRFSQRGLADAMKIHGFDYTTQTLSNWERGRNPPPARAVYVLEEILGAEGLFSEALGLAPARPGPTPYEALEARLAALEEGFRELLREVRGQRR